MALKPTKLSMKSVPGQKEMHFLPIVALRSVTSKSGMGVYASSDWLFKGAVFGRDSLEVAEDLIKSRPGLVRKILLTLASLQGLKTNHLNEEEPGKIIHEYRTTILDGKPIDDTSQDIFDTLSEKWGGTDKELAYYGSIDSTPQFLRTLGMYCKDKGESFLKTKIKKRDGHMSTVLESAELATDWLVEKIKTSHSGLLEYERVNPQGIENQVWKDSKEFYVHESGELANHNAPISSIEVQGLAYDGLLSAAEFFPDRAETLRSLAENLRDKTIELLWLPDRKAFGLGTDFDQAGNLRIIKTETANPAALLDTKFFDKIEPEKRQQYLTAIIKNIMSPHFLTDAGIRSRALPAGHLIPYWDYHGSFVTWPKETYDIAKGLRRQGLPLLANQLENRLLNVYFKNRSYPEFIYVDGHGRVLSASKGSNTHGNFTFIDGINTPERIQAWTVSAIIAILNSRFNYKTLALKTPTREGWVKSLEREVLNTIPKVRLYLNPFSLAVRYPTYQYKINKQV